MPHVDYFSSSMSPIYRFWNKQLPERSANIKDVIFPRLIPTRFEGVQFNNLKADLMFLGGLDNRLDQIKLKWQDILTITFTICIESW